MTSPSSSCGLGELMLTSSHHHFLPYSQPCRARAPPASHQYYLTLGGQHLSTSQSFCQQCISFGGCPKSISVVPRATLGTLCDLCHLSSTYIISLSRFFSLKFLLIPTAFCVSHFHLCPPISHTGLIFSDCASIINCSFGFRIKVEIK